MDPKGKKKGRKLLTVYPQLKALQVLGPRTAFLNQALECWAEVIAQATDENETKFGRGEWNYLADSGNGTVYDPIFGDPGEILSGQVLDADKYDALGAKWLSKPSDVGALAIKLAALDYASAWAVIVAVQFFWNNHDLINLKEDEWWTVSYRAAFLRSYPPDEEAKEGD